MDRTNFTLRQIALQVPLWGAMRFHTANVLLAGVVCASSLVFIYRVAVAPAHVKGGEAASSEPANLKIEYPLNGSVFPPDIAPPTFLFHDSSDAAKRWVVEVSFAGHSDRIRVENAGNLMQLGENDPNAGEPAELSPEQASTRTWKPDEETWKKIKRLSVKSQATVTITGFADNESKSALSTGKVTISTSDDPVGAPIFYRDVPLIVPTGAGKGPIAPLPPTAIPLIKWELRNVGETKSHVVMENLPTCANCHSFSRDGKTMGIDMDGPRNDKGLYAIVPITKNITIRNQDMIRWSSFKEHPDVISEEPDVKRFGFMSQVSPDGRYVVTSIGPPKLENTHQAEEPTFAPGLINRLFSINYRDKTFLQVFYPTRGILAFYDQVEKKMRPLPGADDPNFVQTSAFWSPDGKYLIYSRAVAEDPFPAGVPKPTYANDPHETQIQYDLYKIPFNGGKGGTPVPVLGASHNGMSNDFPKVSPDGKWIVFVQNKNGLLMRPDSKLYMVPFEGGKARLMNCNTWRMNSWHTFSPNGRWLAFSSKARSPFTQLMLTHIDANGNDSPAIIVENTTAANRAVNIPEFINIPQDGLEKIDPQATEFYRYFNRAYDLIDNNQTPEAIEALRQAEQRDPDEPVVHFSLAMELSATGHEDLALEEYRKACQLNPKNPSWFNHLAVSLEQNGLTDEAIVNWRKALELDPSDSLAESDLGMVMFENGQTDEGFEHLEKAASRSPKFADGHYHLGVALLRMKRRDQAVEEFQKAIEINPNSAEYQFNLGVALGAQGNFATAIEPLQKSVELTGGKDWNCLAALANAYSKSGRPADAAASAHKALDLAVQENDERAIRNLREALDRYEHDSTQGQTR
jgi:Flp pilus assembly protein TadD